MAGKQISQALILLHSSIELLLKAELERIHPALIARKKLDYQLLKSLLKKEYQSHPGGKNLIIPDFTIDNTISFTEAQMRVGELYPDLIDGWENYLKHLHSARNNIIHAGAKISEEGDYIEIISTIAYPFLDEFLKIARDIDFDQRVSPEINREIKVSKWLCERLRKHEYILSSYVLKTVGHAVLHRYVSWPRISEGLLGLDDGTEDILLGEMEERYLKKEWKNSDWLRTDCRICGSWNTFVRARVISHENKKLLPLEVRCATCGLEISEEEVYLAEAHIGEFDNDDLIEFFLNHNSGLS